MRVGVIGLGVVGGALAEIVSELGYDVGKYDPHKDYADPDDLAGCELIFLCVWTPMSERGLDVTDVFAAAKVAVGYEPPLVVVRSTVPPGAMTALAKAYPGQHFAFVPEFLVERDPYGSTRSADRIVIGSDRGEGDAREAILALEDLLRGVSPGSPIVRMNPEEAVMVKLASNGLLAAKVAVAVELHDLAGLYGVDWEKVRGAVGLDRRIGPSHLAVTAEHGYGGSCFPKDVRGLITAARMGGIEPTILEEIERANEARWRGASR